MTKNKLLSEIKQENQDLKEKIIISEDYNNYIKSRMENIKKQLEISKHGTAVVSYIFNLLSNYKELASMYYYDKDPEDYIKELDYINDYEKDYIEFLRNFILKNYSPEEQKIAISVFNFLLNQ